MAPNGGITIRMYRVGFGDCFLLSLPVARETRHILIDCGVHSQGDIHSLKDVVANIASVTSRKLAVVIATHAHQDHLAGFAKHADEFAKFEIGEVWLPWTWDPSNPTAVKLQTKHAALAAELTAHFATLAGADPAAAAAVANLTGNAAAIALLKSGFGVGATVRYLTAGDSLTDPANIKGVTVQVLGPPDSEDFLAQMDPPAGQLAFALDKARNNERVVTLISYRGRNLLFAGDAQYGNWRGWLENAQLQSVLRQVNFYKVAHHGSVNATPKAALEAMTDGQFAAMVSTQSTPWASIPRVPLMARLSEKTRKRMVRSDWLHVKDAPSPLLKSLPPQPARLPAGFTKGALWFEYVLPLGG